MPLVHAEEEAGSRLGGELFGPFVARAGEAELERVCQDVLDVLDQSLIPKAESGESKVFYHKMSVPDTIDMGLSGY